MIGLVRALGLLGVLLSLPACEAVVVRCDEDLACDGTAIRRCRVDCDRNGNDCEKIYTRVECNTGSVPGTCQLVGGSPACVDVGATCAPGTPPACNGDATVYCSNQHLSTTPCPSDQTCHLGEVTGGGAPWAYCVDSPKTTCTPGDFPVCLDDQTLRSCVGSAANGYVLMTSTCPNICRPGGAAGGVGAYCS